MSLLGREFSIFSFFWISFFRRCQFFSRMMKSKIILKIDAFLIFSTLKKKIEERERTIQGKLVYNFIATPIAMNFILAYIKLSFTISLYFICSDFRKYSYTSLQFKKFILSKNSDFNKNYT